jgi:hypothetical protein
MLFGSLLAGFVTVAAQAAPKWRDEGWPTGPVYRTNKYYVEYRRTSTERTIKAGPFTHEDANRFASDRMAEGYGVTVRHESEYKRR